ncbi:MAG: glutamyl-tRNA reductase [Desulfobulbaceae bacterium]|jgi:glutamyl-tRNA reductase|nr:glutamyl-tRNA reductase [Desulfobulbaceae bacterium]
MATDGPDHILLVGVNHKTAPVGIREKIALAAGADDSLTAFKGLPGCRECFLLSTCNRVEALWVGDGGDQAARDMTAFLFGDNLTENGADYLYRYEEAAAVHHLFTVASSLDSMVVGEAQILGQLKAAYRQAAAAGCVGAILNRLLPKSFTVAKRVRSETGIGLSTVSISYAAVELAKKIFGSLQGKNVLLIGAGEMAELAMTHLLNQKIAAVTVVNRTLAHAKELAGRFHGQAAALPELLARLETVDIVISSTGAAGLILLKENLVPVMRRRRNRPLFFIDIAVPRDLDPALNELENTYLYDIDDLGGVVEVNRGEREKEAVKAQLIVTEETEKFMAWRQNLALNPTILQLRRHVEEICAHELAKTTAKMPELSETNHASLERMLAAVAGKIVHAPLQYLKQQDGAGSERENKADVVRRVFGFDDESPAS